MASERFFEILVSLAPEVVFGRGFKVIAQQLTLRSGRVDLVLEDSLGEKHIVELKKDHAKPDAVAQVSRYLGEFKALNKSVTVYGWVVANGIPLATKTLAEECGIRTLAVPTSSYTNIMAAKGI